MTTPRLRAGLWRPAAVILGGVTATALLGYGFWIVLFGSFGTVAGSRQADAPPSATGTAPSAPSVARGGQVDVPSAANAAAAATAWARCEAELRAATATMTAGRTAASHWATHLGAQQAFDRGEITTARAKELWKESKAPGPQDVTRFREAKTPFDADRGACAKVAQTTSTGSADGQAGQAAVCAAYAQASDAAVSAATKVVDAWSSHLDAMAGEAHDQAYLRRWAATVKAAPKELKALDDALATVDDAQVCVPPTA